MENKKPIRAAAYIRVGNASQITHKAVDHNNLEARINAALNMKKSAWQK